MTKQAKQPESLKEFEIVVDALVLASRTVKVLAETREEAEREFRPKEEENRPRYDGLARYSATYCELIDSLDQPIVANGWKVELTDLYLLKPEEREEKDSLAESGSHEQRSA
jgi:hypothetical protein